MVPTIDKRKVLCKRSLSTHEKKCPVVTVLVNGVVIYKKREAILFTYSVLDYKKLRNRSFVMLRGMNW